MTSYLLGIATVLALAYLAFGVYVTYYNWRHGHPRNGEHNGPPLTWAWGQKVWVFWATLIPMPILWPLIIPTLRANDRFNRRKFNRMTFEQRSDAYKRWEATRR